MRESICTQCRVNNLARTESFWLFSPGFSSLINNSSNIKQPIFDLHFLKTENCLSFKSDFDRPRSSFQVSSNLLNVHARQCVGASVGLCTRHSLCRTDHIEIYRPRTDCLQWGASYINVTGGGAVASLDYLKPSEFGPWPRTLFCPLCTQVYKWVQAHLMLGVTLRWTSVLSRRDLVEIASSRFMLQKLG